MKELLKYASTKSGGVFVKIIDVTTTTTGMYMMEMLFVDSLAIRD